MTFSAPASYPHPLAPASSVNTSPLTDPVDRSAVAAFAARTPSPGDPSVLSRILLWVFVLGFTSIFSFVGSRFLAAFAPDFTLLAITPLLIGIAVGIYSLATASKRGFGPKERRFRIAGFAAANGMEYYAHVANPPLPGMIFNLGSERSVRDIVRFHRPRQVDVGNYRYTTKSDDTRTVHRWSFAMITLPSALPHIVLDAVGNNSVFGSNLPVSFKGSQKLSLEGDFDRYFSLYCPEGYERDALYLFTPDIMARFVDAAATLDVEIVDNQLFLYSRSTLSTTDPAVWLWIISVIDALNDKVDRWARWRDERLAAEAAAAHQASTDQARAATLAAAAPPPSSPHAPATSSAASFAAPATSGFLAPPPGVANPGQRLRRGFPARSFIAFGVIALTGVVQFVLMRLN